jgi:HAD superfamily hydrolase (TIGR01549 family)
MHLDSLDTVLLDLDGTLLPLDHNGFAQAYFQAFAKTMIPFDIFPENAIKALKAGIHAMHKNTGEQTNKDAFWATFCELVQQPKEVLEAALDTFYETEFRQLQSFSGINPTAQKLVSALKEKGYTLALATNPVFPKTAILQRLEWAGLGESDFVHITHYENSHYCKPNPNYFKEILKYLSKEPKNALMVGNDGTEDIGAFQAGLSLYFIEETLIKRDGLEMYPSVMIGSLYALYRQFSI